MTEGSGENVEEQVENVEENVEEAPNLTPMEMENNQKCKTFLMGLQIKLKSIFDAYLTKEEEKKTNKLFAEAFKDEEKNTSKSNMAKEIIDAEGKVDKPTLEALISSKVTSENKKLEKKVKDLSKAVSGQKRKADDHPSKKDPSGSTAAAAKAAAAKKKKKTSHPSPTLNNQSGKGGKSGGKGKKKSDERQPQKQQQPDGKKRNKKTKRK